MYEVMKASNQSELIKLSHYSHKLISIICEIINKYNLFPDCKNVKLFVAQSSYVKIPDH